VPLNNRLDAVDPAGLAAADAAREWQAYLSLWTTGTTCVPWRRCPVRCCLLAGLRYR
jgi:uncharacterized membrane protein